MSQVNSIAIDCTKTKKQNTHQAKHPARSHRLDLDLIHVYHRGQTPTYPSSDVLGAVETSRKRRQRHKRGPEALVMGPNIGPSPLLRNLHWTRIVRGESGKGNSVVFISYSRPGRIPVVSLHTGKVHTYLNPDQRLDDYSLVAMNLLSPSPAWS